jgi:uncharacterized protein
MANSPKSSADVPKKAGATPDVREPAAPVSAPAREREASAREREASAREREAPAKNGLGRAGDQHRGEPVHPGVPLSPPGIVPESDVRVHTPAAAVPPPEHGHVNEGLGELPWAYGDARLVGMARDPTTLFVYWDFSPQQIEQAFAGLGPARAVLKLWNVRNGGAVVRESDVHLEGRGWYVRDLPPGAELRAELWAVGERGSRLMRAARPVRLPPAVPSEQLEAFYLRLALSQSITSGISTGRPLNYEGAAPAGWERRLQPRPFAGSSVGAPFGSSPGNKLPWSATHLLPDVGGDE